MASGSIEALWEEIVSPEIDKFYTRPISQKALVGLKTLRFSDNISLTSAAIMRLAFDTNRLIRICTQKFPSSLTSRLIVGWYPFSAQFIRLAERNLETPNFALLYAEEVPGLMKSQLSDEERGTYQTQLDELSNLLIKNPSGFQIIDNCVCSPEAKDRRFGLDNGRIINQLVEQGAERYKYIYSQLLLPQTDQA